MFRRKNKSDPVTLVRQKRLATFHRLQHATLALHAKVCRDAQMSCHQNHQRLRLMCIEMVKHDDPTGIGSSRDDVLNILYKIFFRSRRIQHRRDNLAGRNIQVAEQTRRAVTFVIVFPLFHEARDHRLRRSFAFQRLNSRLFIDTHRMNALLFILRSGAIRFANFLDLLLELFTIFDVCVQPILVFVRLQIVRLLKNSISKHGIRI